MTTETTTSKPTTAKTMTRKPTTVKRTTSKPTTVQKTTSKPTTVQKTTSKPTTTEPETTEPSQTTLLSPSSRRRKREAGAMSNESISTDMVSNMDELLNEEESNFDEDEMMQDDNKMTEEEERDGEDGEKGKVDEADVIQVPWSLGYYGLFQLSDSHFCDSGYRWSRNKCSTSCTAFTDDDITDDIDCVLKTGYWR
ncbi:coiled-coil domain-containing protein 80-like isoform X1 [Seriola lalandi dorsalis]|uniref:coiled-coil domain-containing protein 80-like isoform X1 n=1 Tax=Seriola lalandi dorsalis TaxID=1841481 RepID=UPI000C6FAB37|nr:coiled-coil domain-containing protein 80-like isoform X1 [Seriola lalandi dorsalis]